MRAMLDQSIGDSAHVTEVQVRWAECDPAGIVYYPQFFTYFEVGCTDFFATRIGSDDWRAYFRRHGLMWTPRIEVTARFRASARCYERLNVHTRIADVARKIITLEFQIKRKSDDQLLAEGQVKAVFTNADGHAASIPPAVADWLLYGGPPPEPNATTGPTVNSPASTNS
ncbi:MAG: Acyl-CoA thioesterase FadM [Chloroflexi bacterium]|nr:Acyl-CoA thioesterase FadM [Chloroflexota bacterium]